ncbi:hypothetical protein [Streptomyces sp. NPDC048196]|uniref:hypothetical protein n=1 Tax=Streptomyces sp. NPDC048196 TaxID=3154712 RepID=UPI0033F2BBDD
MNIITLAAGHVGDVGKKVGFDMSDGWGAVIAAVATGVFGLVVGILAYKAGRRQVKDQAAADHRAWRLQNRFDAYRGLLVTADAFGEEMDRWRIPTTRNTADLGRALNALASAEVAVRLAGPVEMHGPARAVFAAAGAVYTRCRRPGQVLPQVLPVSPREWANLSQAFLDAQKAFVAEAAKLLDNGEV